MAAILFMVDIQEGHLFASFGLAGSLIERGHRVHLLGIPDNKEYAEGQGFDYRVIFADIYPRGYMKEFKKLKKADADAEFPHEHLVSLVDGALDRFIRDLQPDIFVTSLFLPVEALLIHYKYPYIPQVLLTPILRDMSEPLSRYCLDQVMKISGDIPMTIIENLKKIDHLEFNNFSEFVAPMDQMNELIACPRELEMPDRPKGNNSHYIEASIRRKDQKDKYNKGTFNIPVHKQVIFASLGSQTVLYGDRGRKFFDKLLNIMRGKNAKEWHLVLSIGSGLEIEDFSHVPGNTTLLKWAPQTDILQFSSLVITHGGLGTVKECIFFGVPMVVFPQVNDQPHNAKLIEYHKLGAVGEADLVSQDGLEMLITKVMNDNAIRDSVARMKQLFHEKEKAYLGAKIIEKIIKDWG